jgi:hypothetical protein
MPIAHVAIGAIHVTQAAHVVTFVNGAAREDDAEEEERCWESRFLHRELRKRPKASKKARRPPLERLSKLFVAVGWERLATCSAAR